MKEKIKVAFQGEKGAYSHLACLEVFPKAEVVACSTFEEAFQLAKDKSNIKIVIPIENSLAGRVADIHYLIPKYKLQIHAEHFRGGLQLLCVYSHMLVHTYIYIYICLCVREHRGRHT